MSDPREDRPETDGRPASYDASPEAQVGGPLGEMLREVRGERPVVDWERLDSHLFAALDRDARAAAAEVTPPRAAVRPRGSRRAWIAAAFAVAASGVALIVPREKAPITPVATVPIAYATVCAEAPLGACATLGNGVSLDAPSEASRVLRSDHRLRARVLAGSRAKLVDGGERILLSLSEGSIAAEVAYVAGGEPFAIDVGGTRIAVHGTKLRVAVSQHIIQVAVSEGVAVVGAQRGGRTEGAIVGAGFVGKFRDDGAATIVRDEAFAAAWVSEGLTGAEPTARREVIGVRSAADATAAAGASTVRYPPRTIRGDSGFSPFRAGGVGATPSVSVTSSAAPSARASIDDVTVLDDGALDDPPTTVSSSVASCSAADTPVGLSSERAERAMTDLATGVCECIHLGKSGATYATLVTATVAPSGALLDAQFDPPLDPRWRDCIRAVEKRITFPSAAGPSIHSKRAICTAPR